MLAIKYIVRVYCIIFTITSILSKLPMVPEFGYFCHFSSKLKHFESGSLCFQFCCYFHPKVKSSQIFQLTSNLFVFFSPF
ncbi:hypothetical protein Hanom_Chr07g00597201 [Helianthus anomalus]